MKPLAALGTILGESDVTPSVAKVFLHLWCVKFLKRASVLKNQTFFSFVGSKCFCFFHIRYFISLFLMRIFFIYTRFHNTHEAIVDVEMWQLAHRLKKTIRKPSYPDCPRQSADRASLLRRLRV